MKNGVTSNLQNSTPLYRSLLNKLLGNEELELIGEKEESEATVFLLIDCSGSMSGNKFMQAKDGALGFADETDKKGYSIGLISFGDTAKYECKPDAKPERFCCVVNGLQTNGGTNLTAGFILAKRCLVQKQGKKVICIITDGATFNPKGALEEAELIKAMDIEIIAIGTNDADNVFLSKLVSQKDHAQSVLDQNLEEGIKSMAFLLPDSH